MTKLIRNSTLYMQQDGNDIYICELQRIRRHPASNGTKRKETWSLMHEQPVDTDALIEKREVPLKIRRAARIHFNLLGRQP